MTHDDVLVDPADSTKLLTGRWSELLRRVDVLIARAGITYVQLLDLLVTEFVNPPLAGGLRRVTIQSIDESDPASCDLSKLRLTGSVVAGEAPRVLAHLPAHPVEGDIGAPGDLLDRLLRFLRLQRRTGWTTRELDTAIRQVRPGVLDATTLSLLAALKWTKGALRLSHADACALFGKVDTTRYVDHGADGQPTLPSQYELLFRNRSITNPVDPDFALNDDGSELRKTTLKPSQTKATLAAAFQISETDVKLLARSAGANRLTVQTLSNMYRRVVFARGFKLTVQEMYRLERLAGRLPTPDQIPAFVERVKRLLGSKISVADAWFLLRGSDVTTAHLEPRDDEIAQTLGDLLDRAAEGRGGAFDTGPAGPRWGVATQAPRRARLGCTPHRRPGGRGHRHEAVHGEADDPSRQVEEAARSGAWRSCGRPAWPWCPHPRRR